MLRSMTGWVFLLTVSAVALGTLLGTLSEAAMAQDIPAIVMPKTPAPRQTAAVAAEAPPAPTSAPVPPAPVQAAHPLPQAQLDRIVAPIALYPDPLLSQVLMASTYPLEVVEAARWIAEPANKSLTDDALTKALKEQHWDPSVMALAPFPRLLAMMSDKLDWTQQLGNAFLGQQAAVMSAVQRLRHDALAAGNLKATPECHCVIQTSGETITIMPSDKEVVCIPVYNPRVVYGTWREPDYPPVMFPVPAGLVFEPGIEIGFLPPIELAAFGPLWGWGWFDWGGGRIDIDNARFAALDPGHAGFAGGVWVHDPAHRGGVAYRDPAVAARFGGARAAAMTSAAHAAFAHRAVGRAAFSHGAARAGLRAHAAFVGGAGIGRHGGAVFHGGAAFHAGGVARGPGPVRGGGLIARTQFAPGRRGGLGSPHGGGPHGGGGGHHH